MFSTSERTGVVVSDPRARSGSDPELVTDATPAVAARTPARAAERRDLLLTGTVAALLGATIATMVTPTLQILFIDPPIDLILDTVGLLATGAVAVLAWIRFREDRQVAALLHASAFILLGLPNALHVVLMATDQAAAGGLSLESPGQGPMYVFALARLLAAGLLVVGGSGLGRRRVGWHPWPLLLLPPAIVIAALAVANAWSGVLPPLGSVPAGTSGGVGLPASTPFGIALMGLAALLLAWAALLARRRWLRTSTVVDRYLALGLTVAAFAQVHAALYPSTYVGVVGSGDLLRLAFYVIILFGLNAEAGATMHALRLANVSLERLRDGEVQRAALEERARMSRDLHDGVAQDLWLAKLKVSRLAALPQLDPEAHRLAGDVAAAIDTGLAEARHVVQALRLAGEGDASFVDLLRRCVEEFEDRFGVRAEVTPAGDLSHLDIRLQAELLRVVHEALTNVGRHANATRVRVDAGRDGDRVLVTIRDNGCGFDPSATVAADQVGLAGMRERVGLLGGSLTIESRPQDGTRVIVAVPTSPPGHPRKAAG